ncbi:MAG: alpha/beta fold hydrolase [Gammaproteobacteria bacterium]|nr:alpha/beta fold hydrolase [Gammaproteobacteria bacterium]
MLSAILAPRRFAGLLLLLLFPCSLVMATTMEKITFTTQDGAKIEASLFSANKDLAVVFAHGAAFNKESWYTLAERLLNNGISSLAIDFRGYGQSSGGSGSDLYPDILGAVSWLEKAGFKHLALVGGSMGGAATLDALQHTQDPKITKVILLAPAGGEAITSKTIKKFFIVSAGDGLHDDVEAIFKASAEPKQIKVLPGSAHAQNIFNTAQGPALTEAIVEFLK